MCVMMVVFLALSVIVNVFFVWLVVQTVKYPERTILAGIGWKYCNSCYNMFDPGKLHMFESQNGSDMLLCDSCFVGHHIFGELREPDELDLDEYLSIPFDQKIIDLLSSKGRIIH